MLVTLKIILKIAEAKKCAVGSFNTPNLASIKAVISAAEEMNQPVIIMHAQVHEEMGLCTMDEIAPIMLFMADRASVPVCVHLDHGTDMDYVKKGLDLGFTSVMYDGSELSKEENYANTAVMVEAAARYGASVEAEIGSMGARESGNGGGESIYTDPAEAESFARESGVSHEDYRKVIELGIRKINYYTYMAKAGGTAVVNMEDKTFYHDIETVAIAAMKENVKIAVDVFQMSE